MKIFSRLVLIAGLVLMVNMVYAGSSRTSTTVKDGKKITTKVKTANDGTTTTVVTTKEKDGTTTTSTTVTDKDGNLISSDDPEAKARAEKLAKEKREKAAAVANAPKRGAKDPIQMALFQTVVSDDLKKETTKEGLFPYLRKEFENDPIIKVMDQNQVDRYASMHNFRTGETARLMGRDKGPEFLSTDIYVTSTAKVKEKFGINKNTKKAASAPYLEYNAVIYSDFSDQTWTVTEEGHILNNLQVTKAFADKIRKVILNQAAATIPADAPKYRRGGEGSEMSSNKKDAAQALQNLFKKKKK